MREGVRFLSAHLRHSWQRHRKDWVCPVFFAKRIYEGRCVPLMTYWQGVRDVDQG
jgi:hypothetical protein